MLSLSVYPNLSLNGEGQNLSVSSIYFSLHINTPVFKKILSFQYRLENRIIYRIINTLEKQITKSLVPWIWKSYQSNTFTFYKFPLWYSTFFCPEWHQSDGECRWFELYWNLYLRTWFTWLASSPCLVFLWEVIHSVVW